jgi:hypothetical protein
MIAFLFKEFLSLFKRSIRSGVFVTTLALGLQSRQGLARLRAKKEAWE